MPRLPFKVRTVNLLDIAGEPLADGEPAEVDGVIRDIIGPFNNGWCVVKLANGLTATGALPPTFKSGDTVTINGVAKDHPQHGLQVAFKPSDIQVRTPKTKNGMARYLSRRLPHVGEFTAMQMIEDFGMDDVLTIVETEPERLCKYHGITEERALVIQETFRSQKADSKADLWLATQGVTPDAVKRLAGEYGGITRAYEKIKENPYRLVKEVDGYGFLRADKLAQAAGVPRDSSHRIDAGSTHVIQDATTKGHCYLYRPDCLKRATDLLGLTYGHVQPRLGLNPDLTLDGERVYLNQHYFHEVEAAKMVRHFVGDGDVGAGHVEREGIYARLDDDQYRAVCLALKAPISVITGGPGVGKTYTINAIINAVILSREYAPDQIHLCAPTGKAAKRMFEQTGMRGKTIHREHGFHPHLGWRINGLNPHKDTLFIVDEASMIDIGLMYHLLDGIGPGCRIVFVGDKDQLPSVGPGTVLEDLIRCGRIPVVYLRTLHRQAAESRINTNAQLVNAGQAVVYDNAPGSDMFFRVCKDKNQIAKEIKNLVLGLTSTTHRFDSISDIDFEFGLKDVQVLSPQHKGPCGVQHLNEYLQDTVFNPTGEKIGNTPFRLGDRVIHTKNNYELGVFNGEMGYITGCSGDHKQLLVEIDDDSGVRTIEYKGLDIYQLQLANVLTIHKSQGSEFPVVIIPVHETNSFMLRRNLIYTAISRGKYMVVLVGSKTALQRAIRTADTSVRHTALAERVTGEIEELE